MKVAAVVAVVAIAFFLLGAGWLLRAQQLTAQQLCVALARMVETTGPTPGTADYRYYKAHPKKLAAARTRFLEQLPCHPPAGVGSPP